MAAHAEETNVPKGALIGAALLVLFTMAFAATARLTDFGATRLEVGPAAESISLRFSDLENGAVGVIDADTGRTIETLTPGHNGFVRVVVRAFAYDRAKAGIGPEAPFRLMRLEDGRSIIEDTATGRVVTLEAFGWSNAKSFAALLEKGKTQQ